MFVLVLQMYNKYKDVQKDDEEEEEEEEDGMFV